MRNLNLSNVSDNHNRLPAGGYVVEITNVEDHPMDANTHKGDYLNIDFDIVEGQYRDYYYGMYKDYGFWGGHLIRSYKPKALGMFKAFINELKKDNPGFNWDMDAENDEHSMIGCKFGVVFGEKEYRGNDGSIKTRLEATKILPIQKIHNGEFEVPALVKLESAPAYTGVVDTTKQESFEELNKEVPF